MLQKTAMVISKCKPTTLSESCIIKLSCDQPICFL